MEHFFVESLIMHTKTYVLFFLLLLVLLCYLYTGKKTGLTLAGFFLGILSIFYSPFLYLRKKFLRLTQFGELKEKEFAGAPHYLLQKVILFFQVILVAGTVAILTNALITGYNAMLPPQWLRDQVSENEEIIHKIDSVSAIAKNDLEKLDNEWAGNKQKAWEEYKNVITSDLKLRKQEYSEINALFSGLNEEQMQFVSFVRDSLSKKASAADLEAVQNTVSNLKSFLNNQYYLNYSVNSVLRDLINKWAEVRKKEFELNSITEEQVRGYSQPDYFYLKSRIPALEAEKSSYQTQLEQLESQAEYSFTDMFKVWLSHIAVFIAFIWVFGLIIESLNLSIQIGTDVSRIRAGKEASGPRPESEV